MVEQATFNREVPGSSPGGPTIATEETSAPGIRRPPSLLWAAGVGALAILLLLALGFATDRLPFGFDTTIISALRTRGDLARPIGPAWLRSVMIDITALGGATVLTLVVTATVILLATRRLWLTAALILAGTIGGSSAVTLLKLHVARPRPDIVPHLVPVQGMSFPSGHAANSAIIYMTIAALATQVLHGRATRNAIVALTVLLVGAIGFSRAYLGVHWPSDVLAGWSFGTLWALAWWLVAARIRPHAR